MSTQVTGARRRSRLSAALVGLTLTIALFVLATQASSIWSGRAGSHVRPAPVHVVPIASTGPRYHIPAGCRVKYGCRHGGTTTSERP
jgi:hypothetical protein